MQCPSIASLSPWLSLLKKLNCSPAASLLALRLARSLPERNCKNSLTLYPELKLKSSNCLTPLRHKPDCFDIQAQGPEVRINNTPLLPKDRQILLQSPARRDIFALIGRMLASLNGLSEF